MTSKERTDEGFTGTDPGKHDMTSNLNQMEQVKTLHRRLQDVPDDVMQAVPIVVEDTPLTEGALYIDLLAPEPREFKATEGLIARSDNAYVSKDSVDEKMWNLLVGIPEPRTLDAIPGGEKTM